MLEFKKFGVAGKDYGDLESAKGDTYTQMNGGFPPTNLKCVENPYGKELDEAKYILDFGCGVGRNLPWIMENTNAVYVGLDPNTTMLEYFWDTQIQRGYDITDWKERCIIISDFSQLPEGIKFDYVVTTFVLQHLGYRYNHEGVMNLDQITQNILQHTNDSYVWFSLEHDSEEDWIQRWSEVNEFKFNVYIRSYTGLPELAERDYTAPNGGHHLIIFKK